MNLDSVESFLKTVKKDVQKGNRHFVLNRMVSYDGKRVTARAGLLDLGIFKINEVWDYILRLEPCDCFNISKDYDSKRDYNDDMYEFITYVNNIKTYIKLTMNNKGIVCLSFHKSDR